MLVGSIAVGANGDTWFAGFSEQNNGQGGDEVGRITPQGQVSLFPLPTPAGGVTPNLGGLTPALGVIAAGPDGTCWAIDQLNGQVDRIDGDGYVTAFAVPGVVGEAAVLGALVSASATPAILSDSTLNGSLVLGPDGNLWFGTSSAGSRPGTIDRITPAGAVTAFPLPSGGALAWDLAAGPHGVWFTDPTAGRIGEVNPSGHVVEYAAPAPNNPSRLVVGPDGDAYYLPQEDNGNSPANYVVKVAPGGAVTPIFVHAGTSAPLLATPDGVVFVNSTGGLDQIGPGGVVSPVLDAAAWTSQGSPNILASGPDGNVWFAETNTASIGWTDTPMIAAIGRVDLVPSKAPTPVPALVAAPVPPSTPSPLAPTGLEASIGQSSTLSLVNVRSSAGVAVASATVNWGDGTPPAAGTVTVAAAASGDPFTEGTVSGSHAYAKAGSYRVTVTIKATGPGGVPLSTAVSQAVAVAGPSPVAEPPPAVQAAKGVAFQGAVAEFATPTTHDASGADFKATIDWGDGSRPASGTVVGGTDSALTGGAGSARTAGTQGSEFNQGSGPVGIFQVSGGHTFAKAGTHEVKVTLTDARGNSSTSTDPVSVLPGPLVIAPDTGSMLSGPTPTPRVAGRTVQVNLGVLTDLQGTVPGRTYSATIDWGDGSPPTVAPVAPDTSTGSSGLDLVRGSHAYAISGTYAVKAAVADNQGDTTATTASVTIVPSPAVIPLPGASRIVGDPLASSPLAAIIPASAGEPASDFKATIDWGDGSPATPGTVAPGSSAALDPAPDGSLAASGSHTYATPGVYLAKVTVDGPGGSTQATVRVSAAFSSPVSTGSILDRGTPTFAPGVAGAPAILATFSSLTTGTQPSDLKATVDWGDGSPAEPAAIVATPDTSSSPAGLSVFGSHAYRKAGTYPATVTVVGGDGIPVVLPVTATVAAPAPPVVATPVIVASPPTATTTLSPIAPPAPISNPMPLPVTSPTAPLALAKPPLGAILTSPTILPSPFPKFAPSVEPSTRPVGPERSRQAAREPVAHHAGARPAHLAPDRKHPAGPARLAKTAHLAPDRKHPAGPARLAKPDR